MLLSVRKGQDQLESLSFLFGGSALSREHMIGLSRIWLQVKLVLGDSCRVFVKSQDWALGFQHFKKLNVGSLCSSHIP